MQKESPSHNTPQDEEHPLVEIVRFILIALLIVIPIRIFIVQPFIVEGPSMEPTFHNKNYLMVDQLTYRFQEPQRGDVIVFHYPFDQSRFYIKRVIALPTETISYQDGSIIITNDEFPDGFALDEDYVKTDVPAFQGRTLRDGEYFVMGDNRRASSDSRSWGPLNEKFIVGRVLVRLFPFKDFSLYPGAPHTQ